MDYELFRAQIADFTFPSIPDRGEGVGGGGLCPTPLQSKYKCKLFWRNTRVKSRSSLTLCSGSSGSVNNWPPESESVILNYGSGALLSTVSKIFQKKFNCFIKFLWFTSVPILKTTYFFNILTQRWSGRIRIPDAAGSAINWPPDPLFRIVDPIRKV